MRYEVVVQKKIFINIYFFHLSIPLWYILIEWILIGRVIKLPIALVGINVPLTIALCFDQI